MTDYRTPQAEVHPGDLAPDLVTRTYHAYCAFVECAFADGDATPLTPGGQPTRDYLQARRWLHAAGWTDATPGRWHCPAHTEAAP